MHVTHTPHVAHRPIAAAHRCRSRRERGAGLVEYALLVGLIAVVCLVAVSFLGGTASTKVGQAGVTIDHAGKDCPDGWHLVDQNGDGVLTCQPG